jgi:cobalt-zinc-cadmium efflux system protein
MLSICSPYGNAMSKIHSESTHDDHEGHDHADHDHSSHAGHDHHGHSHGKPPETFNFAFAVAVGLNLLFVIVQAIYALSSHSMSLLADAGHNLGDVMGLALAWGANLLLARGATERYS